MKTLLTLLFCLSCIIAKSQINDTTPDFVYHNKKGDFTLHCKGGICDTIWFGNLKLIEKNKPYFSGDSLPKSKWYKPDSGGVYINSSLLWNNQRLDTVKVIACIINPKNLKTKWIKLYAVSGMWKPLINFNGLMIYDEYLMPDRKTKSKYKVVYAIVDK